MHKQFLYGFKENMAVLNRSPATIKAYSNNVRDFLEGLKKNIKTVTRLDLEKYIAGLYNYKKQDGTGYTTNSIIIKVRSLKRFFEYLERANIIFINPMEYILEPQKEKTLPRNILSVQEVRKILDQPNLGAMTGIRDRAVLELFYSTGIRLNELCSLTIYDADLQGKMLRVNQGKGKKDRVVPMGKHAIRFLREYITRVRPHFTKKNRQSRHLLVSNLGTPLSKQVVGIMIRTNARAAKIKKKVSAHTFRHTFASQLVKNGADIVAVQKMLGHTDLKTTQGYIQALGLDLKKNHQKSHPREKDKIKRASVKPNIKRIRPEYARRQPAATGG